MINIKKKRKETKKAMKIKIGIFGIGITLLFIVVAVNLSIITFIHGEEYSQRAYKNQTKNQILSPKRGNIYDSNGEILAMSISVDTVSINPGKVKYSNEKKVEDELLAQKFSELFDLDYDEVLDKVRSTSSVSIIARKVENDKINELKDWMSENKIVTGINIDEDSKRNYPNNNLASNLLGFCGTDNTGIIGIEERWNDILTGTVGKIVTTKDNNGEIISDEAEQYVQEENGSNIYLTIDAHIQAIAEKYLEEACVSHNSYNGGNVIIMNPQTGDILAMATYPDYNLNDPFNIEATGNTKEVWDTLTSSEKNVEYSELWSNRAVSSAYEPGSTFKILVASVALEENLVETDTDGEFFCSGAYTVADRTISCWRKEPHGYQNLREALQNSCNPAFMQLGQRIGARLLYKYFEAYGLFGKVGDDIAKAYKGVFFDLEKVAAPELATMSFGQRIEISPLQLISAVSAVANDGVLVKPRIVSKIENPDTGSIEITEVEKVRQVISKETADKMKDMMRSVVVQGTGKTAAVEGYALGGKSGTSEPTEGHEEEGYVASFIAIAPIENTQVVSLVTLYGVHGLVHQGGQVAGPATKAMLTEILPYLGVPGEN